MTTDPWNTAHIPTTLLLAIALVVTGGCEAPTPPVSAPREAEHRLVGQAGAADATRTALMALYNALDGDNWTNNTNWGSDEDLSDWYGIWTYSDGYVLSLRDNGLSGELPEEVGDLGTILALLFGDNPNLSGSIPPELGDLSSLRWLEFKNNSVSGSIPPELGNLSSLGVLTITYTSLSGSIPPELGNLSSLHDLNFRKNPLSGSIPPELGNLSSLETMNLYYNDLTGSLPPELGNLSSLRIMDIRGNDMSGSIPSELGNITGLEMLYLPTNGLEGGVPSSLGNLAALERLHLAQNRLTGALPSTFPNLRLDEFSWGNNRGLCVPNTSAFKSWMRGMWPEWTGTRGLCSADREALLGLHDALDGSNWTDSNWGDDTDIRAWRGVTLDSDVRVTELRLGSSGLSGRIPTELADLDRLKVLVVEDNGLVGEVPEAVMDLDLDVFWWSDNPGLCIPDTEAFRTWLAGLRSTSGPICGR